MDKSFCECDLRTPSRSNSRQANYEAYLNTNGYHESRESVSPSRGRSLSPSPAVRRAIQVLDDTYRQQPCLKSNRWSSSAEQGSIFSSLQCYSPSPSRSQSPIRSIQNITAQRTPTSLVEMERDNFLEALDDSESRRGILLKKLSDAQKTMEVQNERVRAGEIDANESKATVRLLQQVQQEQGTTIKVLRNENNSLIEKARNDNEERETLQRKNRDVTQEANSLRCQLDLMIADKEQHQVTLGHLHQSIQNLKDQLKSVTEVQTSTDNELKTTKERLNIARQRGDLLLKEKNHAFSELVKQKKTHHALINRNTDVGQKLSQCQVNLHAVSEKLEKTNREFETNQEELRMSRDQLKRQNKDLTELRKSHCEMREDRERTLLYNQELEKTVHSLQNILKQLKEAKLECEDQLTEVQSDLCITKLELSRISEENNSNKLQLKDAKKECDQLTKEITHLRPKIEEYNRRNKELERAHKLHTQQISLLEEQKAQIQEEKDDISNRLSALHKSHNKLKDQYNQELKDFNQQVIELKQERDKATSNFEETEAKYEQVKAELDENTQHTQAQLDHWRQACSKLTALVEAKDEDLRESISQRKEAEGNWAHVEAERRTLEMQLKETQVSQEELIRLRSENKRISQERAENQQMITVLEMQRDVLAKSPSKQNVGNIAKAQTEKLQAELSLLKEKLKEAELQCDHLEQKNMELDTNESKGETRKHDMNRTIVEELAKLKQKEELLQTLLDEKERNHNGEIRRLEREKQQLDLRMASTIDEINALKINQSRQSKDETSENIRLRGEVLRLKQNLDQRDQQVMVMKGECVILENGKKRAEDKVSMLQATMQEQLEIREIRKSKLTSEPIESLASELKIKSAKLDAMKAENATLRLRVKEVEGMKSSQSDMLQLLRKQIKVNGSNNIDSDGSSSIQSSSPTFELKTTKHELKQSKEDIATRDTKIKELKEKLVEIQQLEQRTRHERDELQGKTMKMESLNASTEDLLKELDEVRIDKVNLEKQLSTFLTSKTSQTPPSSLSLAGDLDKELQKQYNTVCERNKWLENRITSLQREIELVRDQNSLLQEQRNNAEREASQLREDMKELQISSKGSRRQSEVKQIHLQHSNAEKIQKILDMEQELAEKKQLVQAMAKEIEKLQKKSDKGKISNFMKKLRRSSDSSASKDPSKISHHATDATEGESTWPAFSSSFSTGDAGYASITAQPQRSSSLSPKSRSSSVGGYTKGRRNSTKSPRYSESIQAPLSPALTYITAIDDVTDSCTPSISRRSGRGIPMSESTPPKLSARRVSFEDSSEYDVDASSPTHSITTKMSSHHASPRFDDENDGTFFPDGYNGEPQNLYSYTVEESYRQQTASTQSPTHNPSLPSPNSMRKQEIPVFVVSANDSNDEEIQL